MQWFRDLNTSKKLGLAFGTLVLLVMGLGFFSLTQLSRVNATTLQIVDNGMPSLRALGNLKYDTAAMRRAELSYLLAYEHKEKWDRVMKQSLADLERDQDVYQHLIRSEQEQRLYGEFSAAWTKYIEVHKRVMATMASNEYQAGVLAQTEGAETFEAAATILQEDVDLNDKSARELGTQAASVYSSSRYWIVSLLTFALIAGFAMSSAIGRAISSAISKMLTPLQEIAANNLAVDDVAVNSHDEIGKACMALNQMKNNLYKVIHVISATAQQLASSSEQISTGAGRSAENARSQADQTHEVATAMQEMAATVQQVSENSQQAAETSRQSAQAARHGGTLAEEALSTMHGISDSTRKTATRISELGKRSEQIGKIVAVIDDIADQTNLLALNAAIEAARAGEQGRGFAVVADEVRKLAERTTKATKEIEEMIDSIQSETRSAVESMELSGGQVRVGVERTQASGEALRKIIQMSEQVGSMVSQIATAAIEQSNATEDINSNIAKIASSAHQSSTSAEETARACTDLSSLALDLQNLVGQFKLATDVNIVVDAPQEPTPEGTQPPTFRAAAASAARG